MARSRLPSRRLARFVGVGAAGFAVQLGVLGALTAAGLHYLPATALAVEAAVLHNFAWHERWTWRDRQMRHESRWRRALRFNGLTAVISVAGNLALMWWLAGRLGLPLAAANALTVAILSVLNYLAADRLVFLARRPSAEPPAATARPVVAGRVSW